MTKETETYFVILYANYDIDDNKSNDLSVRGTYDSEKEAFDAVQEIIDKDDFNGEIEWYIVKSVSVGRYTRPIQRRKTA